MLYTILRSLIAGLQSRQSLVLEILALRHQFQVLNRGGRRPKLKQRDRALWVLLSRFWRGWRYSILMVKPDTVIKWHRAGFRTYWRLKSQRRRCGRPRLTLEERELIRKLARENPLWGAPRIHGELAKLGLIVSEPTVSKYMKQRRPPSQSWKTFLINHAAEIASVDFFEVATATMQVLHVFVVLGHDRRRILRCEITTAPTGAWAAEQLVEALDFDDAPHILIRDRDQKFGDDFNDRVDGHGIQQILSAHRCPRQNGYVERVIGRIRRDCLDQVIVFNARHLRNVLDEYVAYYNESRTHQSRGTDLPGIDAGDHTPRSFNPQVKS
jgi:transposase InsO family protein